MYCALSLVLVPMALAIPAPLEVPRQISSPVEVRAGVPISIPTRITDMTGAKQAANALYNSIANGSVSGSAIAPLVSKIYLAAQPTSTPTSISDARQRVTSSLNLTKGVSTQNNPETSQNFFANVLGLLLNGITPTDMQAVLTGFSDGQNSFTNVGNPDPPAGAKTIYPKANSSDATYSFSEAQLRAAIVIPPNFTYGKKIPIVLTGATGSAAGYDFTSNIGKLLAADGRFDPVYVNVMGSYLIDIAQIAEFFAYALNYISALTNQKTALVTWSEGSITAQWAFKYWPSARCSVTDSINYSGDYHGTLIAFFLCNGILNEIGCDPAVIQQTYLSKFTNKLAQNNGDSGFVPTTTVYSLFDEIVQPQEGTIASGFLKDVRGVGVSNNYLQSICAGQPAGGIYTHEGVLYNPASWALILDALTHEGPGNFARIGKAPCQDIVAPGLSLQDVIETEAVIPLSLFNIFAFPQKVFVEPQLPAYATY